MKKVVLVFVLIFAVSFVSAAIPGDCDPVPVSFWKFDGDATDSVGGNNGAWSGTASYSALKVGLGAGFDGSNSIEISDSGDLSFDSPFSIEMWIKGLNSATHYILDKDNYKIQWVQESSLDDLNHIEATIGGVTVQSADLSSNTPYFITLIWDGSSTISLYINGVNPVTGSLSSLTPETDNLVVGNGFVGLIDELAIYNIALTPTEITEHYQDSSVGRDYCYVSSGTGSGTKKDFNLEGCSVPALGIDITASTCWREGEYAGYYFCNNDRLLLDTINVGDACTIEIDDDPEDGDYTPCCPPNFICEVRKVNEGGLSDTESYCYQAPAPIESCGGYDDADDCGYDLLQMARYGLRTDGCGVTDRYEMDDGSILTQIIDCKCIWDSDEVIPCVLNRNARDTWTYPGGGEDSGDDESQCDVLIETGPCGEDGMQEVSWTIPPESLKGDLEDATDDVLEAYGCLGGAETRICGQPIVTLPFF